MKENELISPIDVKLQEKLRQRKSSSDILNDFISEFLGQFISEKTQKAYIQDLSSFFQFLKRGGVIISHPNQITSQHFRVYRDDLLEKGFASATINRKLVGIRSFMKWSLACKLIEYNPLDAVKLPKVQTESPTQAFDDLEVVNMIERADTSTPSGNMHRLVMVLLFGLGLRRSELVNIKLEHFFQERNHLVLTILGKGGKQRELPVAPSLKNEIDDYLQRLQCSGTQLEASDYLIQNGKKGKNIKPVDGSTIYRIIAQYAKKCGINKKVGAHSCRATVISHLLDTQKKAIRDVAIFAGHSNITTTERYDKRRKQLDDSVAYDVNYEDAS